MKLTMTFFVENFGQVRIESLGGVIILMHVNGRDVTENGQVETEVLAAIGPTRYLDAMYKAEWEGLGYFRERAFDATTGKEIA